MIGRGFRGVPVLAILALLHVYTAPGAGAALSDVQPVRVAIPQATLFTTAAPLHVGDAKGIYAANGIAVTPIFTKGGGDNVQAVIAGSADIGVESGPMAILAAYVHGAPVRIISASSTGLDLYWFSKGGGPYKTPRDLAGQKVGYSEPGSSSDLALRALNRVLAAQGLRPAAGEPLGGPPAQLAAVKTGQVAAGFSAPPIFLDLVKRGEIQIVARASTLGEYRNVAIRVDFADARFLAAHADVVRRYLASVQQVWEYIFAHHDEAVSIWREKAQLKTDLSLLRTVFDFYTPPMLRLSPLGGEDKIIEDAVAFKFIPQPLTPKQQAEVFDLRYVPR